MSIDYFLVFERIVEKRSKVSAPFDFAQGNIR
jgi:hypothetical protein